MNESNTTVTSEQGVGAAGAKPAGVMYKVLADDHVVFGALHATDGLLILAIPAYRYVWTGRREA
jgi:hypothetical protein